MTVGFVGLGIMGLPMAGHLARAGHRVVVYNRSRRGRAEALAFGARVADSPADCARGAEALITMVTGPADVRAVMDGADGAFAGLAPGAVWIQMSTIDIASATAFAADAVRRGVDFVDCPVTGSKKQVEAAELILLAGATNEALARVRPLLAALGKTVVHAGPAGAGTALKLCMNLIVAQMTTAAAEAVALAEATHIDPALIFQALSASPALNCGYFRIKGPALLNKDFAPAFSLDNMAKDVGFMLKEAAERGQALPVTEAVRGVMAKAQGMGLGGKDLSVVWEALKR